PRSVSRGARSWVVLVNGLVLLALLLVGVLLKGHWSVGALRQRLANTEELAARPQPAQVSPVQPTGAQVPRLIGRTSRAIRGQPAPLGLNLEGHADGGVVIVAGLLPQMTLSVGSVVGVNSWQLPARNDVLDGTWIIPPKDFLGAVDLVSELRLGDKTIADRQALHVEWQPVPPELGAPPVAQTQRPAAAPRPAEPAAPAPPPVDRAAMAALVKLGKSFMASGDLAAARLAFQRA